MNAIKKKAICLAGKVFDSKAYKVVEKGVALGSAALVSVGSMVTNASATDAISVTVDTSSVLTNASPFITLAVTILCAVGGIKLGWGFLKRAFH